MSEEIIKLIERFLSHTLSDEEMEELLQACQQERISEKQFDAYYAGKWSEAGQYPALLASADKKQAWEQFRNHLRRNEKTEPKHKNRLVLVACVAAAAVLFFMLGLLIPYFRGQPQQELIVTVENGQKAGVQLPDGSYVHLNSASELRYSPDFGKKNRTVQLTGEAYFEVRSNPENPFIVLVGDGLQIKALGTKFNIKSYPNDAEITGTLIEGRIVVSNPLFSEMLSPYERITYYTKEMKFKRSYIESEEEAVYWLTDQFVFDRETLGNIAKMMERMYNVTVSFASPDITEIQYSGKIKNNSMENILNLITVVSPLQYTVNGSHILISEEQK